MKRPVVIHRRASGFRRNPEAILISDEEAMERIEAHRADRVIPEEVALRSALAAYAAVVGWSDAKGWRAARAHEAPATSTPKPARFAQADARLAAAIKGPANAD